jgi:heavy metal translocating P-type ATPase
MTFAARWNFRVLLATSETRIAIWTLTQIMLSLALSWWGAPTWLVNLPLWLALTVGGIPLVWQLAQKLWRREFGSDLLAGISIVVSVILGEYLAGSLVVLMLSGGEALESYAVSSARSVLQALSRRMPAVAHRKNDTNFDDIDLSEIVVGDLLVIFPHEICPVDGTVVEGHGVMDESYLTGEPFLMSKTPGSSVISGSINGDLALVIRADAVAVDSRYAKIMRVMQSAEQNRPQLRRLGDQLGAWYTPLALAIAAIAWLISGEAVRFLAVLVVATPCPLLIAIPVAIIGSISLAAKRAIIIKDPSALEIADQCRTIIFDKTGTLTYGEPQLTEIVPAAGFAENRVLGLVASLERYSKHPLSVAIVKASEQAHCAVLEVTEISEKPGAGLTGRVAGQALQITSRKKFLAAQPQSADLLPPQQGGLECIVLINEQYAATFRFRDTPRSDGASFVKHLQPRHRINRALLVSGDRESEVQYLADRVGIPLVYASQSPEQKLEIVRRENDSAKTIFVGDGINDAPALMAASVGIAFGQNSDVTSEAADVVVLDSSLQKVDEFLHISRRMRRIALQSALGGMGLSLLAMGIACFGFLTPVMGALIQEIIDVFAVLNALRVSIPPPSLFDYDH